MIRLGRTYDNFILFVIFIKVLFIISAIFTFLLRMKIKMSKNNNNKTINIYNNLFVCKETLEFIFIICIAFICIIVFYPYYKDQVIIDRNTRLLLFIYGFIILITANWSLLTSQLPMWFLDLQKIFGNKKIREITLQN
jgi:hypothetical protein